MFFPRYVLCDGKMNIYDLIKMRYLSDEITEDDIERYVRERMLSQEEAELILNLKNNSNS